MRFGTSLVLFPRRKSPLFRVDSLLERGDFIGLGGMLCFLKVVVIEKATYIQLKKGMYI